MQRHVLDATDLAWLARCERRVWLDQRGDPPAPTTPTADARARLSLRSGHIRRMLASLPDATRLDARDWADRLARTNEAMARGDRAIIGAALEAPFGDRILRGAPHILARIDNQPITTGTWRYQPIGIALHSRPTRWDRLLLDAWRWLVGAAQGDEPPGELWLGVDGSGPARVSLQSASLSDLAGQMAYAAELDAGDPPPIWFDSDHCPFCAWRQVCDAMAHETDDIALLPGLSRRQGMVLRRRGVRELSQVLTLSAATLRALPDWPPYAGALLRLQAQALLTKQPLLLETQRPAPRRVGMFIDIETDPMTQMPWAFGLAGVADETQLIVVGGPGVDAIDARIAGFNVTLVQDIREGWQAVFQAARRAGGAVTHWGEAERLILARSADPLTQRELMPLLLDAQHEIGSRAALPVPRLSDQRGGGLKAIARWIGVHWPQGADHWTIAWDVYQQWRSQRTEEASLETLEPAVVYLAKDVAALAAVWRWFEAFAGPSFLADRTGHK